MEEQYVEEFGCGDSYGSNLLIRFTSYDFKKMQRRSYYPQNQQIVSTVTATSSSGAVSRPVTPTTDVGQVDSANGSNFDHKPSREMDSQTVPMTEITNEKGFAL